MVLLLSLALASCLIYNQDSQRFDDYRDVSAHMWLGDDAETIVESGRALIRKYVLPLARTVRQKLYAEAFEGLPPRAQFSAYAREGATCRLGWSWRGINGGSVTFWLSDPKPIRFSAGAEFTAGLRPASPGEDTSCARAQGLQIMQEFAGQSADVVVKQISVKDAGIELEPSLGVAVVLYEHYPRSCGHRYGMGPGSLEIAVENRMVVGLSRSPQHPVRPGDTPTISLFEAEQAALAAWQRYLAWPSVALKIDPPTVRFIANNTMAAQERSPDQERVSRDGVYPLMYTGMIWDTTSLGSDGLPARICLFQVDAVEGNVMNFLNVSGAIQLSFGAPERGRAPTVPFDVTATGEAISAAGSSFKLSAGDVELCEEAEDAKPTGASVALRTAGSAVLGIFVNDSGDLWLPEAGERWRRARVSPRLSRWLMSLPTDSRPFGAK